jgi:hypothetical protein
VRVSSLLLPTVLVGASLGCWSPSENTGRSTTRSEVRIPSDDEASATVASPPGERFSNATLPGTRNEEGGFPIDVSTIRVESDSLIKAEIGAFGRRAQCDPLQGSPLGQVWYVFGDDQCHLGFSVAFVELVHTGWDGLGCTLNWTGHIERKHFQHPFAGIGVDLERDIRDASKMLLEVRGDGRDYRAEFILASQLDRIERAPDDRNDSEDCDALPWDFFGHQFTCGDGTNEWQEIEIDLATLTRRSNKESYEEGDRYDFTTETSEKFQIVTLEREPHDFQCEFRVVAVY